MSFIKSKWQGSKFEEKLKDESVNGDMDTTATPIGLSLKIMEIGDWDMDTVIGVSKLHNLEMEKIRILTVCIRDDINNNLQWAKPIQVNPVDELWYEIDNSSVYVYRKIGGVYDANPLFDSIGYNRGWITILYEA